MKSEKAVELSIKNVIKEGLTDTKQAKSPYWEDVWVITTPIKSR